MTQKMILMKLMVIMKIKDEINRKQRINSLKDNKFNKFK